MTYFPDKTLIVNQRNIYEQSKEMPRDLHNLVLKFASVDRNLHQNDFVSNSIDMALKCSRGNKWALEVFECNLSILRENSFSPDYIRNLKSTIRGVCFTHFSEQIKDKCNILAKKPELLSDSLSKMSTFLLWVMKRYEQPELNECRWLFRKSGIDFPELFDKQLEDRKINKKIIGKRESLEQVHAIILQEIKNSKG